MMNNEQHKTPVSAPVDSFQGRVQPWMMACFGAEISADGAERNHRFLEESLELVQACGCTASEACQLVDYVYGRPVGERAQEVGGVMVTLAALCLAQGLDMHTAGETELTRIWTKVEAIRAKQAAKPKHSPLPAAAPQVVADERAAFEEWAKAEGLIQESFGIRSTNSMCDVASKAWAAGRAALAAAPVQAQEPVLVQAFEESGSDMESGAWFDIAASEAKSYADEGYKVRKLFTAPVQPVAVPDGWRDAALESAVQAVAERARESEKIDVINAFDAIRSLKKNRHALPESCSSFAAPAAPGDTKDTDRGITLLDAIRNGVPLEEPVSVCKAMMARMPARVVLDKGAGPLAAVHIVNISAQGWTHNKETATAYADGFNRGAEWLRSSIIEYADSMPADRAAIAAKAAS